VQNNCFLCIRFTSRLTITGPKIASAWTKLLTLSGLADNTVARDGTSQEHRQYKIGNQMER
jgi:hypothetical protein